MLLYRGLISLFAMLALPQAVRRGGLPLLAARLGFGVAARGPQIWWHGASNGELISARPILDRIVEARPDLSVMVTCNSATGLDLVESWALPRVTARPAPLDLGWVTKRVMRRGNVVAHVTLESELWPMRCLLCSGPVIVLGARMSAGTARSWARLPRLARRVLGKLALSCAQDPDSAARLARLGLPRQAQGPVVDLKAFYLPDPVAPPESTLQNAFPRVSSWLAASTHPGEDQIVLQAHRMALEADPGLRLILAPRHPKRGPDVARFAREAGFETALRSRAEDPSDAQVYVVDTMGEMAFWYQLAGRVFIAGSLSDRGGHTPYEPASFSAALIYGPDMANHRPAAQRLAAAGAATEILDAEGLATALFDLRDPDVQRRFGSLARETLQPETDVADLAALVQEHLRVT